MKVATIPLPELVPDDLSQDSLEYLSIRHIFFLAHIKLLFCAFIVSFTTAGRWKIMDTG